MTANERQSSTIVMRSSPSAAVVGNDSNFNHASPTVQQDRPSPVAGTHVTPSEGQQVTSTPFYSQLISAIPTKYVVFFFTWKIDQWLATIILYIIPFVFGYYVKPACRVFFLDDYEINYPYTEDEMFPTYSLVIIVLLPIVVVYFPVIYFFGATSRYWGRELNAWIIVQLMATGMALAMVNTTKVMGGRYRPDFVARMRREGLIAATPAYPPVWNAGFSQDSVCETKWLQDNHVLRDGHLSFPSGHSGTAFSAMLPLCFFLMARLRPFFTESLWRLVACFVPLVLAWVVALSRTLDYRHNYSDILAGGIIGVICGGIVVLVHFRYVTAVGVWALKIPSNEYDAYVRSLRKQQAHRTFDDNGGNNNNNNVITSVHGSPLVGNNTITMSPSIQRGGDTTVPGAIGTSGSAIIDIPSSPTPEVVASARNLDILPQTNNYSIADNTMSRGNNLSDHLEDHHRSYFTTDRSTSHIFRTRGQWDTGRPNADGQRETRSTSQLGLLRSNNQRQ